MHRTCTAEAFAVIWFNILLPISARRSFNSLSFAIYINLIGERHFSLGNELRPRNVARNPFPYRWLSWAPGGMKYLPYRASPTYLSGMIIILIRLTAFEILSPLTAATQNTDSPLQTHTVVSVHYTCTQTCTLHFVSLIAMIWYMAGL